MGNGSPSNGTVEAKRRYERNARWYDLVEFVVEALVYGHWRKELFTWTRGNKILEIGVGTGKNLRYYPAGAEVTAIDFSERMLSYPRRRLRRVGSNVGLQNMDAENLHFETSSFPNVIATFVFCSVPDPVKGLKQARKVCTPDGRLVLLEHVRPRNAWLRKLFDLVSPKTAKATGVNINRDTAENIRKAGFQIELEKDLLGNIFKLFVARPKQLAHDVRVKQGQGKG